MKKRVQTAIILLLVPLLLFLVSCGQSPGPEIAKLPTPEPTSVPTDAPTAAPTLPCETLSATENANEIARQIELPDGFIPERKPEYLESGYYTRYSCSIGEYTFVVRMGTYEMELLRIKDMESESIFSGLSIEPFQGVTETGIYVCSWEYAGGSGTPLLPADHLFFIDADTCEAEDLGEAINYCVQTNRYLIGQTEESTSEDGRMNYTLWRFDLETHERVELCSFGGEENSGFYGKWFGGDRIFFTFLSGYVSTDFGIYMLNVETGELEKLADHGLPYALDENGVLLYVDFFDSKPYIN